MSGEMRCNRCGELIDGVNSHQNCDPLAAFPGVNMAGFFAWWADHKDEINGLLAWWKANQENAATILAGLKKLIEKFT